jgi:hypothetical protein
MTETETLIAEVRQLRADVARLHAAHTAVHIQHGWMGLILKDLSTNPYTQYKVHMWGAIYWLVNFPLICCLFFFTPTLWLKLGIFITLIYSIYANLATDYGAMSAAEAAFGEPQPPPIPLEPQPPLASRCVGSTRTSRPSRREAPGRQVSSIPTATYLLDVCGLCRNPSSWPWSSFSTRVKPR